MKGEISPPRFEPPPAQPIMISGLILYLSSAALVSRPIIDWCKSTWFNTLPSTYLYPSLVVAFSTASEIAHPRLPVVPGCFSRILLPTSVSVEG